MRVVRVYHAGRDSSHRARERALAAAGVEVTLIVPTAWPETDTLHAEPFEVIEFPVRRAGDVNRHTFRDRRAVAAAIAAAKPDIVDLHEEPVAAVTHQLLSALDPAQVVVGYTAQNIDKRWPPPYARRERAALARLAAIYPCSSQAASVVRGKGFTGLIDVVPLGIDPAIYAAREPRPLGPELRLAIAGRIVEEKGVLDAVRILAEVLRTRPARLTIAGLGPATSAVHALAAELGVAGALTLRGRLEPAALGDLYRSADVLLVPSHATRTWVEQFGRVVAEGQACGAIIAGYATGSIPEVSSGHGLLVGDGDHAALAEAISRLDETTAAALRRPTPVPDWAAVAAAQLELYEAALRGPEPRPAGRAAAHAEFGPTAAIPGESRPFAAPLLRGDNLVTRAVGAMVDRGSRAG